MPHVIRVSVWHRFNIIALEFWSSKPMSFRNFVDPFIALMLVVKAPRRSIIVPSSEPAYSVPDPVQKVNFSHERLALD